MFKVDPLCQDAGNDTPRLSSQLVELPDHEIEKIKKLTFKDSKAKSKGSKMGTTMKWSLFLSTFMLNKMCELIASGVRTDKGFKEVHLNTVAKLVFYFCGHEVTSTQIYNHLRKWRSRCQSSRTRVVHIGMRILTTSSWRLSTSEATFWLADCLMCQNTNCLTFS